MQGSSGRCVAGFVGKMMAVVVVLAGWNMVRGEDMGWPRVLNGEKGKVTIYQPQVETLQKDKLTARAAVSVLLKDKSEPVFGAVWFDCRVLTDRDARTATIWEVKVPRVKFANATPEQEGKLKNFLEDEVPNWDMTMSLDRLEAGLEATEKAEAISEELKSTPPKIVVVNSPAVLVTIDGKPELRPVANSKLMKVVNTPFVIVLDPGTRAYYLFGDKTWYMAEDISGSWRVAVKPPAAVVAVTPKVEGVPAEEKSELVDTVKPRVILATEPTELIVTDGDPEYSPLVGSDLLYMSNTENDVVMDVVTGQYYVLLSGRWFRGQSLSGPWSYVASDKLPKSFSMIPPDSEKANLLAGVAGTDQAKEAVMDNQIPQTTAIKRSEAKLQVTYDGEAKFQKIEGTTIDYAVNTDDAVLKIKGKYYACHEGVWFVSKAAAGPWIVSDSVPTEVQTIPPSCPVYNVKYVSVYDATPELVYVGYTPAYLGSYVYGSTVWWGTGYTYPGWYGQVYYPRPATWGFRAYYNPWTGNWAYGVRYERGFIAAGSVWGNHWHAAGWWGPGGYRGFSNVNVNRVNINNRNINNINVNRNNIYNRQGNMAWRGGNQDYFKNIRRPEAAPRTENNLFADRNGDVYRRSTDGWQKREATGWGKNDTSLGKVRNEGSFQTQRSSNAYRGPSNMDRDYQSRQRGEYRSQNFQRENYGGGYRGFERSGGFRGGGGRRR
jgi:hypothetical protein